MLLYHNTRKKNLTTILSENPNLRLKNYNNQNISESLGNDRSIIENFFQDSGENALLPFNLEVHTGT